MERWRLLCLKIHNPYLNMAIEEAIFIAVNEERSPNTVRFWRNARSVVIGRNGSVISETDFKECRIHGVKVVRRFTGGGTVYQDLGNLNWTFVISRHSSLFPKTLSELYEFASAIVIGGLKGLGITNAEFRLPPSIWIKNRKVSGLAAYMKRNTVLCHGTLLINADIIVLSRVLSKLKYQITNVKNKAKGCKRASINIFQRSMLSAFKSLYNVEVDIGKLNAYEDYLSKSLYRDKYSQYSWNFMGNI